MCTKQFRVGRIIIKASRLLCDVKLKLHSLKFLYYLTSRLREDYF